MRGQRPVPGAAAGLTPRRYTATSASGGTSRKITGKISSTAPGLASPVGAEGVGSGRRPMVSCWAKSPPGCCGREAARWCVSS